MRAAMYLKFIFVVTSKNILEETGKREIGFVHVTCRVPVCKHYLGILA